MNELLYGWFKDLAFSFKDGNQQLEKAVEIKLEHTFRVCNESKIICKAIGLDETSTEIADIIALLHDAGRFEQFKKYNTFSDRKSINHAVLAVTITEENQLLKHLPPDKQNIIKKAILYHNLRELPTDMNETEALFCNIVRDADKLDIYRIVAQHYTNPDPLNKDIVEIGVEDSSEITDKVCQSILDGKTVDYKDLRTLNDFKLAQIGWVFDFYFPISLSLIKSRGHFDTIKSQIPVTVLTTEVLDKVESFLKYRLQSL